MMIRYILFFLSCYLLFAASAHPIKGEVGAAENDPKLVPVVTNGKRSRDLPDIGNHQHFDTLRGGAMSGRRKRLVSDPEISARKKRQQRHDSMRKRRSIHDADRLKESFAVLDDVTAIPSI